MGVLEFPEQTDEEILVFLADGVLDSAHEGEEGDEDVVGYGLDQIQGQRSKLYFVIIADGAVR